MDSMDSKELERELINRLINSDEEAFCDLYALYKNRLMYFAMKFLKSKEFAEDVFQDAFASVWQNRRFLNPESPFSAYIYTIVRNRILNLLSTFENEKKLKESILSSAIEIDNETSQSILDADLSAIIEKAIENLTPQQSKVFEMSRKRFMSHKEIAAELGISVYTVQQHISTSLRLIRTYLTKYSETYTDLLILLFCLNS
ncbi:MAG: RNA polymerase sigma-70 factor [Parabacteroides sp.]|jgi:RNA polymerase sigma-70 factor (ECF subfamily)|nr:RNA polymerase sigma-70 factor [Parabacteroides sp.]MDD4404519.1 RNA polymerase sigma-70 factor [Parabacteroides sp.]